MRTSPSGRADGLHLKTDSSPQFVSTQYREGCSLPYIVLEAIRKRKLENDGMVESMQGHFKMDYVFITELMSFAETKLMLSDAVKHYNEQKPHSSLGYMTPSEYRKQIERESET